MGGKGEKGLGFPGQRGSQAGGGSRTSRPSDGAESSRGRRRAGQRCRLLGANAPKLSRPMSSSPGSFPVCAQAGTASPGWLLWGWSPGHLLWLDAGRQPHRTPVCWSTGDPERPQVHRRCSMYVCAVCECMNDSTEG